MLTVYPSNKMEDLVQLLNAVQAYRGVQNILSPDIILVESKGIQHWLNLELAKIQGIAMNYQFQMPASFIWDLARTLLGTDAIPYQSTYRKEVLAWRLDLLMSSEEFISNADFSQAFHYWAGETQQPDRLKRFQLVTRLAGVFEQYLLFRPKWLIVWEQNQSIDNEDLIDKKTEQWQAWLWRQLVMDEPLHPIILQQKAIQLISETTTENLPSQIMIFAINTMAPHTLEFFNALSSQGQCNIHLFYLNPCVEFWGDVRSDKTLARQIRELKIEQWLDDSNITESTSEDEQLLSGNSLISNLGQQGKEFFNLLQEVKGYEISAFSDAIDKSDEIQSQTILSTVQNDILSLTEPKYESETADGTILCDASIIISSSHSELREVQALHDYLLHQFNAHADWKPQDVVVMCPAIEDYAPYIEAVFRRPWDKVESEDGPKLACSIADRSLLNAEPLIATLSDLLLLPDSRFEISKILDYLRLPAIQAKFGFENSELDTIEWWLKEASIHWGRDAEHKQKLIGLESSSPMFTWQWGLERLLLGFTMSDSYLISEHSENSARSKKRLLLPHVEGQDALLLGRLMQLLERLKYHALQLCRSRTAEDWRSYLLELMNQFFIVQKDENTAYELIQQVFNDFAENTDQAQYKQLIDYEVMRNYLQHHFSQADSTNHFMTGQVTFCSMIPMRSIPFKVIAILGLNDGQFPRQSTPMSFDLMTQSQHQKGDRSHRGDDRYLFLEAIISARHNLYLSYQGRDIHKNSERQPSLILKELMTYLENAYGWKLLGDSQEDRAQLRAQLTEQPLHPFSMQCYSEAYRERDTGEFLSQASTQTSSFDPSWMRMINAGPTRQNLIKLAPLDMTDSLINIEYLVRFFDNPLKEFSLQRLNLKLENDLLNNNTLEDAEPFLTDSLIEYQVRDEFCHTLLENNSSIDSRDDDSELNSPEDLLAKKRLYYELSGELPESPISKKSLDSWQIEADIFSQAIVEKGAITKQSVSISIAGVQIETQLHWLVEGQELLIWRPTSRKAKDDIRLWLTHLLANIVIEDSISTQGLFFNKKTQQVETVIFPAVLDKRQAQTLLEQFIQVWKQGLCEPSLMYVRLAKALFENNKKLENFDDFENLSADPQQYNAWNKVINSGYLSTGLDVDAYFQWYYPQSADLTRDTHQQLYDLYQSLYWHIEGV